MRTFIFQIVQIVLVFDPDLTAGVEIVPVHPGGDRLTRSQFHLAPAPDEFRCRLAGPYTFVSVQRPQDPLRLAQLKNIPDHLRPLAASDSARLSAQVV